MIRFLEHTANRLNFTSPSFGTAHRTSGEIPDPKRTCAWSAGSLWIGCSALRDPPDFAAWRRTAALAAISCLRVDLLRVFYLETARAPPVAPGKSEIENWYGFRGEELPRGNSDGMAHGGRDAGSATTRQACRRHGRVDMEAGRR